MRTFKRDLIATLAVAGAVACGESAGPSQESLEGTWTATKAEMVDASSPTTKVDLVARGGTVRLVLAQDQSFTLTVSVPGEEGDEVTGTWSTSADEMTLTFGPGSGLVGEMQFDMSLSGITLSLGGGHTPYDFNGDGIEDEARLYLVMVKQP